VFGLRLAPGTDPIRAVEPWGKTDRQILRDVLARAGIDAPDAEAIARWERSACAAYERLEVDDAADGHVAEAAVLARLAEQGHTLALVTGNLEPIARRKLSLRGLERFFPRGQGGFGSDGDLRPELVRLARSRAGARREDTVLIGDTPRDVEAAAADGVRAIGVEGHRFSGSDLLAAGAAATVREIAEVEAALASL
jgi:phosphoglycolate phosphatase-like HAD superfamily hydrolase